MCTNRIARQRCGKYSGFTMVELVIFIVIVGIAVVGILQVMNVTTSHSADPQMRKQALSIAEALMEEVVLAPFTYCDAAMTASAAGCTVEDGLGVDNRLEINTGNAINASDINSNAILALNGYRATIAVVGETFDGISNADALHITVTVTSGTERIVLDGYRTRYMPGTVQ
jgi:MSHA pilin protein MshD